MKGGGQRDERAGGGARRGDVSLAELLTAMAELAPDAEATAEIHRLLRLERLGPAAGRAVEGGYDPDQADAGGDRRSAQPPPPTDPPPLPPPPPRRPEGPPLPASLREVGTTSPAKAPDWIDDPDLVAFAPPPAEPEPPVDPQPLFAPLRRRAILAAGLATRALEGEVDVDRLIVRLVRREAISRLPRLPVPTLRRGVWLYLDHSPAMVPYAHDRRDLQKAIEDVAGRERTEVFFFRGCPRDGVASLRRRSEEPWRPPPRGTVVALATDLGIGGDPADPVRASVAEWRRFAAACADAGCPVVAFVPFHHRRWPGSLARAMTLVHWDRSTSARVVARAVGGGHEVTL